MTIEQQMQTLLGSNAAIVASLNAQAQTLTSLVTAVANIAASTGTAPDLSQINDSLSALADGQAKLLAATTDIQAQLETPAPDQAPLPAPEPAPAPAPEPTNDANQGA